nr:MAG TPA: holin [Caudoviricetes sp.]
MNKMLKDAGNQSVFWSGFGAFWAMYTLQEWLAIFGLLIGLISGLVNMYAKCQEGKVRDNEERRAEEMHKLKMEQLKRGLRDDSTKD